MVAPLNQYYTEYANRREFFKSIQGYRQAKPYNIVTTVRSFTSRSLAGGADCRHGPWGDADLGVFGDARAIDRAGNQAYQRLMNQLGDGSSFGATLTAERKETASMVTGAVIKAARAARAVKKLDFRTAASTLGLPYLERTVKKRVKGRNGKVRTYRSRVMRLPTGREVLKTSANGWLLWSYGVKPLVDDIKNGMDFLTRDQPDERFVAGGRTRTSRSRVQDLPWGTNRDDYAADVRVRSGAFIKVINHDAWLRNRMGLDNPVQWALEGVPFSFVVDWFSNLSSVISSLTDMNGLSVSHGWTSIKDHRVFSNTWVYPKEGSGFSSKEAIIYRRSPGIVSPRLIFAYERPTWQRALNAISLLIGFLPRK